MMELLQKTASTPVTIKTLFSHPESHPVVLDIALLSHYGPEWFEWEPETVHLHVMKDFGSFSDLNMSKIMAMKTLHVSDRPWKAWEVFLWCSMPPNNLFPDFEVMQVPNVAQCLVAVDVMNRVRTDVEWSEEVKSYLQQVHIHEGVFLTQAPINLLINVPFIDIDLNLDKVKEEWPGVRSSKKAPQEQTAEAEQLRKLLEDFEYLEDNRAKLRAQLPLVQHHV